MIQGNRIGTDVTGRIVDPDGQPASGDELGNTGGGIQIYYANETLVGGTEPGAGNLISGNTSGVIIAADVLGENGSSNLVQGNLIGTDLTGTMSLGNRQGVWIQGPNNLIGGAMPGAGNLISRCRTETISLSGAWATGNKIQGNLIGTDITGLKAMPNANHGVFLFDAPNNLVGGDSATAGNVIACSTADGVFISGNGANSNRVQGNFIGTSRNGVAQLGNGAHGVELAAAANQVGGILPGAGNTIAFKRGDGVFVNSRTGNAILANSIHSNSGLGIDLAADGPKVPQDPFDADPGANNRQNFPVLASAAAGSTYLFIRGSLPSAPNQRFHLEFFATPALDPLGFGEGATFLGSLEVTTELQGEVAFATALPFTGAAGGFVTATATSAPSTGPDDLGDTSEFAPGVPVEVPVFATASGVKFYDLNHDGVHDPLEPGLDGWVIYADLDNDGVHDRGEPSATTHDGGHYTIQDILAGTTRIREEAQPAWHLTTPVAGFHEINFEAGLAVGDLDFGNSLEADFGDAPLPYPTLLADNGALHPLLNSAWLRTTIDAELDGIPSVLAEGDDGNGDDEDGVVFLTPFLIGSFPNLEVTASVPGYLNAWVDFNRDGDWSDPEEQVLIDKPLEVGLNRANFLVPASASQGNTFARFRFSTRGGLSFSGPASDGEGEDYRVRIIVPAQINGSLWNDFDADGVLDEGEPGLAGWTIFLDADGDGAPEPGELSTLTEADGNYTLTGVAPGAHTVTEALLPGWEQTLPGAAIGEPFQVNTRDQPEWFSDPVAAMNESGDFVIVWEGPDEDHGGIFARRFTSDGTPLDATEFQVNTQSLETQWMPAVAMDQAGNFVIAWTSNTDEGLSGDIFARRYSADGGARDDVEFQVNTLGPENHQYPTVGMDAVGDFVIAWTDFTQSWGDVFVRRYAADGTARDDAEFQVNNDARRGNQPAIAMDAVGNFVLAWTSHGWDIYDDDVLARRYAADGTPQGAEFPVHAGAQGTQEVAAVAMDPSGKFVVTWQSWRGPEAPWPTAGAILAQRYLADGTPDGTEFLVNNPRGPAYGAAVALNNNGDLVISWDGVSPRGNRGVFAQRYTAGATSVSQELAVGSSTSEAPSSAIDRHGNFVIAWVDGLDQGPRIMAQRWGIRATHRVLVAEGQNRQGLNFASFEPAGIHGTKWEDADGNGAIDPGEPALAGWPMYLDQDLDHWPDRDEPRTLTDTQGQYWFRHLPPGEHTVTEAARDGWRQMLPAGPERPGLFYGFWQGWRDDGYLMPLDASGHTIQLGSAGEGIEVSGLAYDPDAGILYGSSNAGELWTFDLTSGAATSLGGLPMALGGGLTYNPLDRLLYSSSPGGELVQVDPVSLTASVVSGPGPADRAWSVAFSPSDGRIYFVEQGQGSRRNVYWYDAVTFAGPTPAAELRSFWDDCAVRHVAHNGTALVILGPWGPIGCSLATYDPETGYLDDSYLWTSLADLSSLVFVPGVGGGPDTHRVELVAGQHSEGSDFANYQFFSTVRGTKFDDQDGDGTRTGDEPGLSGFRIYVDLDDDGVWDSPGEPAAVTEGLDGAFLLEAEVPPGTYKVREVTQNDWLATLPAEGYYEVTFTRGSDATGLVFGNRMLVDFGDAPAPYPTLLTEWGARHRVVPGFSLGTLIDHESDAQQDVAAPALGDDNHDQDDEDGVVFLTPLVHGEPASLQVTASVLGVLDAWIDFNADGDWADVGERIFTAHPVLDLPEGNRLIFTPPSVVQAGPSFARFRFSKRGVASFEGPGPAGEVEDYRVVLE